MTDYQVLTDDYQVHTTTFGDKFHVVANFGATDFKYNVRTVKAGDFIFYEN